MVTLDKSKSYEHEYTVWLISIRCVEADIAHNPLDYSDVVVIVVLDEAIHEELQRAHQHCNSQHHQFPLTHHNQHYF